MPKATEKRKPTSSLQTNSNDNSSSLYWLLATFTSSLFLVIAVMYAIVRNQSNIALINQRVAAPFEPPILTHFFPAPIDNKNTWLDSMKFSIDESFSSIDRALILEYTKLQKKILSTASLTPANKLALSKTTIHWVTSSFINHSKGVITRGFVFKPKEVGIVMHPGLIKEELRSTLLNEIHHLTILEINQHKVKGKSKVKNILEQPFLNEQGEMDNSLRKELSNSIDELNRNVKNFISLFANKHRNTIEEKKFSIYLEAVKSYRPKVYRVSSDISDSEIDVVKLADEGATLYRNKRPVVYEEDGKIQLLCSANKNNSPLELAEAFFYDYTRSYMKLKKLYESRYKSNGAGKYAMHSAFLSEVSSDIDELLTPKMKQVFAKRFKNYFDNYARSYLAEQDASHHAYNSISMRAGMKL
jgi:hypothetical protein